MGIRVTHEGDRWVARFPWSVEAKDLVKSLGFRFDGNHKLWWTGDPAIAMQAETSDPLEYARRVNEERAEQQRRLEQTLAASRAATSDFDFPIGEVARRRGLVPFGFQRAGVKWALDHPRCLIGDEMGLGKSLQAIGVINADQSIRNALIICKASLKGVWLSELRLWLARDLPVCVCEGQFGASGGVVILNYEMVAKFRPAIDLVAWDLLVIDETHAIKNDKAQRTRAIIGKYNRDPLKNQPPIRSRRVIFLSGTPIVNRPVELWTTVNFLDPYGLGKNFYDFATRYCAAQRGRFGFDATGASHLDELQARLRSSIMIRRLKADVLTELPEKRRQIVAMKARSAAELEAIADEAAAIRSIDESLAEARAAIEQLSVDEASAEYQAAAARLRQARQVAFEETSRVRHRVALAKVPQVLEYLHDALEANHDKLVVFAYHHDVIDALRTGLTDFNPVSFDGRDSLEDRNIAIHVFQNSDVCRVFIGSLSVAREGITLTAASTVVFCEIDWVPGVLAQAEDRLHRIGQRNPVLVQHLVLEGSLDARMTELVVEKMGIITRTVDTGAKLPEVKPAEPGELRAPPLNSPPRLKALTQAQAEAIHHACQLLAGVCDGAQARDAMGYNGTDANFGHSIAAATRLTLAQANAAKKMLQKYRRQLGDELLAAINGEKQG